MEADTESHINVSARRRAREAEGGTANLRNALSKRAATHYTNAFALFTQGVFRAQIPVRPQPVLAPLPNVAMHIVESEPVRQESADWRREHVAILRCDG